MAVTEISGRAWVRQPDGSLTELAPGSTVPAQSEVVTASGASVTLSIDGAAPITIGEDRSVAITDELATPIDPSEAVIQANMTDSDRLLAALESGDDPFNILEATAAIAGGPGGDDGGGSFVRLLRIFESTTPLDLAYPRPNRAEEDLTRLSGDGGGNADTTPPTASVTIDAGTGPNAGRVWESALPGGTQAGSGAVSTSTFGQISVTATDGINTITINGQTFTLGALTGQAIPSGQGTLTIDSVTVNANGTSATIGSPMPKPTTKTPTTRKLTTRLLFPCKATTAA